MERKDDASPPPEVQTYYSKYPEESRLELAAFRLEFERTKEILARVLPAPPARIVDVGGAAGAYSFWLAGRGYDVHLVDASARLVDVARSRNATARASIASLSIADARRLPQEDGSAAAILVMGPLYHLPSPADRLASLREASVGGVPSSSRHDGLRSARLGSARAWRRGLRWRSLPGGEAGPGR